MCDFLFVDDGAVKASSEDEMQQNIDKFSSACTKKTEVMFQPPPHTKYSDTTITVKCQKLQTVDKFTYLDSTLSRNVLIDDEAVARIAKGSTPFGRRHMNVWERQGLNHQTKLKVYKLSCSRDHSPLCLRNIGSLL